MNLSPVPTGWSAGMQKTITSTSERVSRTTSLSRRRSRLLGLCSPGVSTSTSCPPGRWTTPRMACRVVWGRLLTMPTFSPTIALVSVVFPALGRPTRATKPLRCGICSGGVTRTSLPPGADGIAAPGRGTVDTRRQVAVSLRFLWGVLLDDPLGVLLPGTSTLMTWDMPRGSTFDTAAVAGYVRDAPAGRDDVMADAQPISADARAHPPPLRS